MSLPPEASKTSVRTSEEMFGYNWVKYLLWLATLAGFEPAVLVICSWNVSPPSAGIVIFDTAVPVAAPTPLRSVLVRGRFSAFSPVTLGESIPTSWTLWFKFLCLLTSASFEFIHSLACMCSTSASSSTSSGSIATISPSEV